MFVRFPALLAFAAVVIAVSAKPIVIRDSPITLPIARRANVTAMPNIVKADKARAQMLKARAQGTGKGVVLDGKPPVNFPVTNEASAYVASVGVGTPPTVYNLIVDTGSSNTWVGANTSYVVTPSSNDTGESMFVSYGSGLFFGELYTDTVTLGDLVLTEQGLGVAGLAIGFDGLDGILGLGPSGLTKGTTSGGEEIPTVTDTAFAQGKIAHEILGISFEPTNSSSVTNGQLTFGGVDSSKVSGAISYVPITSTDPASEYVGIDQSITYGSAGGTTILSSTSGITDTGTTLVMIASDAFTAYQTATGGVLDATTGLLKITKDQFASLQSLFFHIGENTYEFTANAQIWPRALNTLLGGDADSIYLIVSDLGSSSGTGLDFIDGMTFLERFYYVYDIQNSQVGFANTPFTWSIIN